MNSYFINQVINPRFELTYKTWHWLFVELLCELQPPMLLIAPLQQTNQHASFYCTCACAESFRHKLLVCVNDVSREQDSEIIQVIDVSRGISLMISSHDVISNYVAQIVCL